MMMEERFEYMHLVGNLLEEHETLEIYLLRKPYGDLKGDLIP